MSDQVRPVFDVFFSRAFCGRQKFPVALDGKEAVHLGERFARLPVQISISWARSFASSRSRCSRAFLSRNGRESLVAVIVLNSEWLCVLNSTTAMTSAARSRISITTVTGRSLPPERPSGSPGPMDKGHCKKDPPIQSRPAFGRFVLQLVDSVRP